MKLLDADGPGLPAQSVVSIGMFDGVHRGHRSLLARLRAHGQRLGLPTVVLTFDPHPRAVLAPHAAPLMLSSVPERLQLLQATALVDHVVVLPFDRRRSEEPVESFVRDTLVGRLRMRALVVGENFACGRGRSGNVQALTQLGMLHGFDVIGVPLRDAPEVHPVGVCSSTATRRLILDGDVRSAAALLERPHEVTATVTRATLPAWIDAALAHGRCAPPPGDYLGAVRLQHPTPDWTSAVVQVKEDSATRARYVRIRGNMQARPGDAVAVRFLDQARAIGPCAALTPVCD